MSYAFGVCGFCACLSMILIHLSSVYNLAVLVEISKVSLQYFKNSETDFSGAHSVANLRFSALLLPSMFL